MIKRILFLLLIAQTSNSQTFQRECGWPLGSTTGYALQQTNDGSYIFAGYSNSVGSSGEVYLIKTDVNGDTLWTMYCGNGGMDDGRAILQTIDNGFIIAGLGTANGGGGAGDFYLVKTNDSGEVQWTKTYGGGAMEWANSITQTNDGGYGIAGVTQSFGAGDKDIYVVRTNSTGDTLWTKTYGGANEEYGYSIRLTSDNGFIISGSTRSFGAGNADFYLLKTDSAGNTAWSKTFGSSGNDYGYFAQQTYSGGYIMAGGSSGFGAGQGDGYVICTNSSGNLLWSKTYGTPGADGFNDLQQTSDGGFIMCGRTYTPNYSMLNAYLVKINSVGDTLWTSVLENGSSGNAVRQTADGGYILTGASNFGSGTGGVYFAKTDASGNTSCMPGTRITTVGNPLTQVALAATIKLSSSAVVASPAPAYTGREGNLITACFALGNYDPVESRNPVTVFPNPANGSFTISTGNNFDCDQIEIRNLLGVKILELQKPDKLENRINALHMLPGLYLIRVRSGNAIFIKRISIQ